jgi:hypothetical protein
MLIEGVVEIETVAIAEDVHVPVPDNTVYVVDTIGETTMEAELGGLDPLLAVQTKGPEPLAIKFTTCPKQMVDNDGVIAMVGDEVTETVAIAEFVHVPVPVITV